MIPATFDYLRATTLHEALTAIGQPGCAVICGGQSLIPLMRFRRIEPSRLVDIGALPELRGVTVDGTTVRIGAATTYRQLLESSHLHAMLPLVPEVAELVGDLQLRNLGTLGGALVYADPFSDMPAVMLALGATMQLQSLAGHREVPAHEFFRGPFQSAVEQGELLLSISIPIPPHGTGTAYANVEKSASGYSQVGAAASITRGGDGLVSAATLAVTSVAPVPFLASVVERLVGTNGPASLVSEVASAALDGVPVHPDAHTTAEYRRHLASIAVRRALTTALERAS